MIEINSAGLKAGLKHLGLEVDESVADKFLRYAALLVRWNKTYNLTAISNASDVLTHHLLDSAALVPELKRLCPDARTVLDVGSGGGLPAVPVALLCPELKVLAVDAVGKKTAFINQAAIELGLPNLQARHTRVEALRGKATFDVVTSRAFATLADFTDLTRGLLAPGGRWLAMKGVYPQEEIDALGPCVSVDEVVRLRILGLDAERHVVLMHEIE